MSAVPLAHLLPEFEEAVPASLPARSAHRYARLDQPVFERLTLVHDKGTDDAAPVELRSPTSAAKPAVPAVDTDAEREAKTAEALRAAREAAFHDGRASLEAEMQVAMAEAVRQERVRSEATLAAAVEAARGKWVAEESVRLAGLFETGLELLEASVRETLSSVLKPAALAARTRQTLAELADAVRPMTLDGRALRIEVKGPQDLLDAFAARLGDRKAMVAFQPDASMSDITVKADRTLIETRLVSWRQALDEALS